MGTVVVEFYYYTKRLRVKGSELYPYHIHCSQHQPQCHLQQSRETHPTPGPSVPLDKCSRREGEHLPTERYLKTRPLSAGVGTRDLDSSYVDWVLARVV